MAKQKAERYPGEFDEYDRLVSPAGVATSRFGRPPTTTEPRPTH